MEIRMVTQFCHPIMRCCCLFFCFDSVWGINIETETKPKAFSPTQTSQARYFQKMGCALVFQFEFVIWYKLQCQCAWGHLTIFQNPHSCDKCTRWLKEPPQQFASPNSNFAKYKYQCVSILGLTNSQGASKASLKFTSYCV